MANPNYHCYGFLIIISCVVLLIAPICARDDDGGSLLGGKKLIIGLPYYKSGFPQFVDVQINSTNTNQVVQVSGYSISVFNATIAYLKRLHHNISFEFRAFVNNDGSSAGDYGALVRQISEEKYDAVVGDVTILENRLNHADFTLPYTQANVKMLVKIRRDPRLNMWIFVRPFSWSLWLSIAIFSVFIGAIILFMERNVKKDSTLENSLCCKKQFSGVSVLWLPVVQAVFPERESLAKNCSRFVLVMWLILVFVLMQSYTACLSSILTVHQLQPRYLGENDVIGDATINIGYHSGSFVRDLLVNNLMVDSSRVKNYSSIKEYKDALDKGSHNGGVDAIFDEAPYFKAFVKHYSSNYAVVVSTRHHAGGFGFAFPKGSSLTSHFSKAILHIRESNEMDCIEDRYFGSSDEDGNKDLSNSSSNDASPSLTAYSFAGLFILIGTLSLLALAVSESHIWKKSVILAKTYSQQFWSPTSTRISPLEEVSRRNVDKECPAGTQNIGSAENETDNKTLPV